MSSSHDMDLDTPETTSAQNSSYAMAFTPPQSAVTTPHRPAPEGPTVTTPVYANVRMADSAAPESPAAQSEEDGEEDGAEGYPMYGDSGHFTSDRGYRRGRRGRASETAGSSTSEPIDVEHSGFFNNFGDNWHVTE
ncbi:hypothetical protein GGI12_000806 [Dipsacomyces acuminosporus]|nr:hypothetical protein GGI12_000806 [Dipsacomyces acuminosporus]